MMCLKIYQVEKYISPDGKSNFYEMVKITKTIMTYSILQLPK